jgi:hypothetical protein
LECSCSCSSSCSATLLSLAGIIQASTVHTTLNSPHTIYQFSFPFSCCCCCCVQPKRPVSPLSFYFYLFSPPDHAAACLALVEILLSLPLDSRQNIDLRFACLPVVSPSLSFFFPGSYSSLSLTRSQPFFSVHVCWGSSFLFLFVFFFSPATFHVLCINMLVCQLSALLCRSHIPKARKSLACHLGNQPTDAFE